MIPETPESRCPRFVPVLQGTNLDPYVPTTAAQH